MPEVWPLNKYWLILGVQSVLCLVAWTVMEVVGAYQFHWFVAVTIGVLFLGGYAAKVAIARGVNYGRAFLWGMVTLTITFTNYIVLGLVIGQALAMLFGVWEFPAQS